MANYQWSVREDIDYLFDADTGEVYASVYSFMDIWQVSGKHLNSKEFISKDKAVEYIESKYGVKHD